MEDEERPNVFEILAEQERDDMEPAPLIEQVITISLLLSR